MSCAGWKRKKIGELFDVQLGKMLNEKAKQGEQYPYLANFNVRWGSFDLSKLNKMYFSEKEKKKFSLRSGDLLMCEGGAIGRCAVWNKTNQSIYYQKALHRLRPLNHDIESLFVYYFMEHIARKGELSKIVGESSIAHLTREKLLHLIVTTPPRNEQKMIVRNLITWDQVIEKAERLIAAKEKQYTWLLSNLISNVKHQYGHVRDFASEVSTRNTDAKVDRVLSVTNNRGFVLPEDHFERRVASDDLSNYKVVTHGQYAYNPSRINVGSIARLDAWVTGALSPMYVVFELNERKVNSDYFLHWLESHEAKERIRKSAQGSVRETVSFTDFSSITLPLPSLDTQRRIVTILNSAQNEIDLLKK